MKSFSIILGCALLTGTSAFAMQVEYMDSKLDSNTELPKEIRADKVNINPDDTTTVVYPRLVRGNKSFPFANSTNKEGVCKAMGFESFLPQGYTPVEDGNASRAYVTSDGRFVEIKNAESHSIADITCYNGQYKTYTKVKEYVENVDGTVTAINPRLVRGNKSFPFSNYANKDGVCRAMGFKSFLTQSYVPVLDENAYKAHVTIAGNYVDINTTGPHSLAEITCLKTDNYTTVVIDSKGNTYFRKEQ